MRWSLSRGWHRVGGYDPDASLLWALLGLAGRLAFIVAALYVLFRVLP